MTFRKRPKISWSPGGSGERKARWSEETESPSPRARSTASSMAPFVLPHPMTRRSPDSSPYTAGGFKVWCSTAIFRLRISQPRW